MRRKHGPYTAEDIQRNATRTFEHFAPDSVRQAIGMTKPKYYYHYGITPKGTPEFMGPESQLEAERYAAELEDGEVFELETRNLARATAIMKAELISRGIAHDEALRKVKHTRR